MFNLVRRNLINMMYGVVLAYGFNWFDKAWETGTHLTAVLFFFSYSIIIIDWLYVQNIYWVWDKDNKEYSYHFFVIDLCILFIISRLIHVSAASPTHFWLWVSMLYFLYVVWDIFIKVLNRPLNDHYWVTCIVSDGLLCILYSVLSFFLFKGYIELSLGLIIITIVAYIIMTFVWGRRFGRKK